MASQVPPIKNAAFVFYINLISQSSRPQFQANPTLAAGDVKVCIDDGAPANMTTLPTVDADHTKRVKVSLSASEMNGDVITILFSDAAGSEWDDVMVEIQTASVLIDDLPTATENADSTIRRQMDNVEASSTGDTLDLSSLYGLVQMAQEASISGTTLTVKKTDGSTTLGTKTVTQDASANPITGVA